MIENIPSLRLSLENIERSLQLIDPVFLNTPQFQSDSLSRRLEMVVILKVETVNPIRSFKGRGADFLLACLPAEPQTLVCASAGNFGQGLAYAAGKRSFRVVVFAAHSANPLKVERMRELGAEVRLFGSDFDQAKEEARRFAEHTRARFIEDGREPEIAEGAGTIAVELWRSVKRLETVLIPLGDGALVAGIEAMRLVFCHHGLVIEPAGVAGLAAAIAYKERFRGSWVATPLCGGNLTSEQIGRWLSVAVDGHPGSATASHGGAVDGCHIPT